MKQALELVSALTTRGLFTESAYEQHGRLPDRIMPVDNATDFSPSSAKLVAKVDRRTSGVTKSLYDKL